MATLALDDILLFNDFVNVVLTAYKRIYKLNKNDKCYLYINSAFLDTKQLKEIHDVVYILLQNNKTVNIVAYSDDLNVKLSLLKEHDKFCLFDIIHKTFDTLNSQEILNLRDYLDYDKSKSLIDKLFSNKIRRGKYLIGSGDLALHFENYIASNLLSCNIDIKSVTANSLVFINQLYNEISKNLDNLKVYLDLAINANKYNCSPNQYISLLQIDLLSVKTNNDKYIFEEFVNSILAQYRKHIFDIRLKRLRKTVFTDVNYSISILFKFDSYFDLLFYISVLNMIKNV